MLAMILGRDDGRKLSDKRIYALRTLSCKTD